MTMLLMITSRTPPWVWALLAGLVLLGLLQARARSRTQAGLLAAPLAMLGFALFSMAGSVAAQPLVLPAWALGFGAALLAARQLPLPAGLHRQHDGRLHVPGSWLPMLLILGLFTLRYAVNVSQALHPELRAAAEFITPVALGYGAISGLLLGRVLWQLRRAPRGAV